MAEEALAAADSGAEALTMLRFLGIPPCLAALLAAHTRYVPARCSCNTGMLPRLLLCLLLPLPLPDVQIHWPDRYVPLFGAPAYDIANEREGDIPFEEQLRGLDQVVKAGKVSGNDTANMCYNTSKLATTACRGWRPAWGHRQCRACTVARGRPGAGGSACLAPTRDR